MPKTNVLNQFPVFDPGSIGKRTTSITLEQAIRKFVLNDDSVAMR